MRRRIRRRSVKAAPEKVFFSVNEMVKAMYAVETRLKAVKDRDVASVGGNSAGSKMRKVRSSFDAALGAAEDVLDAIDAAR